MIEDVFKLIDESVSNVKKFELIYPTLLNFFIDIFKRGFKSIKSKHESDVSKLNQEKNIIQDLLDRNKDMLKQTRDEYEGQISELKEQQHVLRSEVIKPIIKLEAKIDERNILMKNIKDSHDNTVDELSHQIDILKKQLEKKKIEKENIKKQIKEYDPNHLESKITITHRYIGS